MKGMIFKKAFLIGGIFLLATFMSVPSSWTCDDDDKWDRDCRDKWNCDHHGKPCHPPKIQRVFLEYKPASDTSEPFIRFSIWGKNFDNGDPPVVMLGGEFDLTVTRYSHDYIQATLPMSVEEDFDYGDYRLVVSTCCDSSYKDKRCKDHGPNCKCKYCKEHCSKCKDKYCKDYEYKCRCKDRYSLTIPGPPGPPSPIKLERVESELPVPLQSGEHFTVINDSAKCKGGWLVTGGGFSCPDCSSLSLSITVNEPFKDLSGWHVAGSYSGGNLAVLTTYAICAQVQ